MRPAKRGRGRRTKPRVDRNALSARGDSGPPRRSRSSSPDAPPAKRASSAGSSICGYDSETPHEIQNEALYRACRAYGLGEQFLAAAQDEGTFGEWLDELPFEVAAATARLLKHHARSGAWVELSPGNPSQASVAGVWGCSENRRQTAKRDRKRQTPKGGRRQHHTPMHTPGAWVEITPGSPSQAPCAGRDRDRGSRSSPNCPSDMSEPSDNSD
eukprot:CAMPEP_0185403368 /NCGR_PEP_ID=MMETSP1364-20130426/92262_1 /TAXON_ID=38817 /ORGANISM="Gephyrocapsa oceanica, Strain RCC1303" /LENGTH=213 /DNA_ID=CAMNT_0028005667 /DNA_START=9 /DNA_END=651 /DNA_ORIENTATION=+